MSPVPQGVKRALIWKTRQWDGGGVGVRGGGLRRREGRGAVGGGGGEGGGGCGSAGRTCRSDCGLVLKFYWFKKNTTFLSDVTEGAW